MSVQPPFDRAVAELPDSASAPLAIGDQTTTGVPDRVSGAGSRQPERLILPPRRARPVADSRAETVQQCSSPAYSLTGE